MREPDAIALKVDHVGCERGGEPPLRIPAHGAPDELERRLGRGGGHQKRRTSLGWKSTETAIDERCQRVRQGLAGLELDRPAIESATKLEGEERVSARQLVQASKL